ncbi:[LysW]-lysine hydrolase [Streptomyces triticagri]|uniref:[LysW]-lysine hydrolase n=1 Tax=Streptomyces triticagri TaxID=2293568 RepID=A0A372M2S6_9ACTN|nr:[LysW]-lysine hydrolase [Streptomyces triticagri]
MARSPADPVALLTELVAEPSVSGAEGAAVHCLVRHLHRLGFAARVDEAGNAVGEIGDPDGPTVMLLGHIDTVPGDLPVLRRGELLYGRGTVDAKGPLAAMAVAASRAAARGVPARLLVVGAVDEEGLSRGARHLAGGPAPDAVVIGEPSGVDGVVLGYKGILRFRYDVTRPAVHTSSPEEKATEVAAEFWSALRDHLAGECSDGPYFEQVRPALVSWSGDIEHAELDISCRLPPGFDTDALLARLRRDARGGRITVVERTEAVRSPRSDPVARALTRAIRDHGLRPVPKVKLGSSDMNVVAPRWNVPVAAYGPGDAGLDHTDREHLDLRDYRRAIDVLTDALGLLAESLAAPVQAPAGAGRKTGVLR